MPYRCRLERMTSRLAKQSPLKSVQKIAFKMNSAFYKYCAVPQCKSTTKKTPNKLYIFVPSNVKVRETWLRLASRNDVDTLSSKSRMYFCEDHFDLPNDMENYMQYCIMGSVRQIKMKPYCVPSKFKCQPDRATSWPEEKSALAGSKRRRTESDAEFSPHELNGEDFSKSEDEQMGLHEEISLPLSPSYIKQEEEYHEDSQTEHKVADYDTIINNLKEEITELKSNNQRLTDENQRLTEKNQRLNDKNSNLTSGIDQLLQKTEDQMTNYEQLNDFVTFAQEKARLTSTIQQLNKEVNKHVKNIQEVSEQKQRLTERVKEFQQRIREFTESKDGERYAEAQQIHKLNKKLLDENQDIKQKNLELNKTISELKEKIDNMNRDIKELTNKNKSLTERIESNRSRKTVNFKELAEIRSLTEENQALAEQVRELTEKLVGKENKPRVKRVGLRR